MASWTTYSPELIADMCRRYVETDESIPSIAARAPMHPSSLSRLIKKRNWPRRRDRPPLGLAQATRAEVRADEAVRAREAALLAGQKPAGAADATAPPPDADRAVDPPGAPPLAPGAIADELEATVVQELAAVQRRRAELGTTPHTAADAERTARTLRSLTETLVKVRRLRLPDSHFAALPMTGHPDDNDLPEDIDAFRHELARRIRAFVRSRTGGGLPAAGEPARTGSPQP